MELIDAQTTQVAAYQPFYSELAKLESDNAALVFNYETPKGNKEARSHVHSLRKTKGALERVRKEAKAEYLRLGRAVDSEASEIEARIEAMITVHQAEIDKIEQREKDRVAEHQMALSLLIALDCNSVEEYRAEIARVEKIPVGPEWEEFMAQATKAKADALVALQDGLAAAIKRDEEAAELARLRAEAEARAQADRDAAIAKAAADKAQREAEEKAAAERAQVQAALDAAREEAARREAAAAKAAEDAKAEAKRKEEAAALALKQEKERALAEQEAAARREMQLKLDAEQAEQRRIAAEKQAEQERKDALARAEQQAAAAVQAEKDRAAAEEKRIADEAAKRERNRAHKAAINRAALDSLVSAGIPEECAKQVVTLIAQGKVENVSISY